LLAVAAADPGARHASERLADVHRADQPELLCRKGADGHGNAARVLLAAASRDDDGLEFLRLRAGHERQQERADGGAEQEPGVHRATSGCLRHHRGPARAHQEPRTDLSSAFGK
ncbi:MAG: hypothetical protein ACK55I_34270, partial [bacterium]